MKTSISFNLYLLLLLLSKSLVKIDFPFPKVSLYLQGKSEEESLLIKSDSILISHPSPNVGPMSLLCRTPSPEFLVLNLVGSVL